MSWDADYIRCGGILPDRDLDPPEPIYCCVVCGEELDDPYFDERDGTVLCDYHYEELNV